MALRKEELQSEALIRFGVYEEHSMGNWCFKYSFPMVETTIVSHPDKEKAASRFFIEYLKSLHYSMMAFFKGDRLDELSSLIGKMKEFESPSIDKTIKIFMWNIEETSKWKEYIQKQ